MKQCLDMAKQDFAFDHKMFHRKESGEMMHHKNHKLKRPSLQFRHVSEPILPTDLTKLNLGKEIPTGSTLVLVHLLENPLFYAEGRGSNLVQP